MSVATQLGLDDPDRGLLAAARHAWRGWAGQHEALGVVAELEDLPAWLTAHPGERSTVLGVLSGLAAQQEGDDVPAAAALAWLLVPGASLLANRLATLSPDIDELVAAQLWIEVRTFGSGRGRRRRDHSAQHPQGRASRPRCRGPRGLGLAAACGPGPGGPDVAANGAAACGVGPTIPRAAGPSSTATRTWPEAPSRGRQVPGGPASSRWSSSNSIRRRAIARSPLRPCWWSWRRVMRPQRASIASRSSTSSPSTVGTTRRSTARLWPVRSPPVGSADRPGESLRGHAAST